MKRLTRRTRDLEALSLPNWYDSFLIKDLCKLYLGMAGFLQLLDGEMVASV